MSQPLKPWVPTVFRIFVACVVGAAASIGAFLGAENILDRRDSSLAVEIARARADHAPTQSLDQLPELDESFALAASPRRLEWMRVRDRTKHLVQLQTVDLSSGDLRASGRIVKILPFFLAIALVVGFCAWLVMRPSVVAWKDDELGVSLERWSVETAEVVQAMASHVRSVVKEAKEQRRVIAETVPRLRALQKRTQSHADAEVQGYSQDLHAIEDALTGTPEQQRALSAAITALTERLKTHLEQVEHLERKLRG